MAGQESRAEKVRDDLPASGKRCSLHWRRYSADTSFNTGIRLGFRREQQESDRIPIPERTKQLSKLSGVGNK